MAGSHYPEYYLKKRRRDTTYRRIVQIVVGVMLFAIVGGCTGYLAWNYYFKQNRQHATEPAEQAKRREELNVEQRIADAQRTNDSESVQDSASSNIENGSTAGSSTTELSGIDYAQSLPAVKVDIEGSNKSATKPPVEDSAESSEGDQNVNDTSTGSTPTPPGEREDPGSFKPKQDEAKPTEKPEDKPKPETEPEEVEDEKPKQSETKPSSGGTVFHVYAGACGSQEDAEKMKANLSAIGIQGEVIKSKLDYLVKVASLEDYDSANSLISRLKSSGFDKAFATRSRN